MWLKTTWNKELAAVSKVGEALERGGPGMFRKWADVVLGDRFRGAPGSVRLMVGLKDLRDLFLYEKFLLVHVVSWKKKMTLKQVFFGDHKYNELANIELHVQYLFFKVLS